MELPSLIEQRKESELKLEHRVKARSELKPDPRSASVGEKILEKIESEENANGVKNGLREVFEKFDTNRSGGINKEEFANGCVWLGLVLTAEDIDLMW
jgi:hypothetical protein